MHFSIPDTQELSDEKGSSYIGYNIHINGLFHCTLRYKQLLNLNEQLKKKFGHDVIPPFPPKKFFTLTASQLEERRVLLEKFIQMVGQNPILASSEIVIGFLLSAQQETLCEKSQEVGMDIYTMGNNHIPIRVSTFDGAEQVLRKLFKHMNLPLEYIQYFSLYLIKNDNSGDIIILRKLLDFESPYLCHKTMKDENKVVIRKSYWDSSFDTEVMKDPVSLNLLYVQTLVEVEKGWIAGNVEEKTQLASIKEGLAKREYIELAQKLQFYGFVQFLPCYCDYPKSQTKVVIAIGGHDLNMRFQGSGTIGNFMVTRIKCWRVKNFHNKEDVPIAANSRWSCSSGLMLSFEYLINSGKLQWITIMSDQAPLMSVCLQTVVDELVMKKNGVTKKLCPLRSGSWSYMRRDGSYRHFSVDEENGENKEEASDSRSQESFSIKRLQEKFSSVSFKSGRECIENHAFEGIGDDDL